MVPARITEFNNSEGIRQRVIAIVEPANIATAGKIVENADSTLTRVKDDFVKMQTMTTQLDEKLKGTVQLLEDMRLAGVKLDQDAGEKMRSVEDKLTQINEAQRVSVEAINQKTED